MKNKRYETFRRIQKLHGVTIKKCAKYYTFKCLGKIPCFMCSMSFECNMAFDDDDFYLTFQEVQRSKKEFPELYI